MITNSPFHTNLPKSDSHQTCAKEIIKLKGKADLSFVVIYIKEKLVACKYQLRK